MELMFIFQFRAFTSARNLIRDEYRQALFMRQMMPISIKRWPPTRGIPTMRLSNFVNSFKKIDGQRPDHHLAAPHPEFYQSITITPLEDDFLS
jgi:hypothetical protein